MNDFQLEFEIVSYIENWRVIRRNLTLWQFKQWKTNNSKILPSTITTNLYKFSEENNTFQLNQSEFRKYDLCMNPFQPTCLSIPPPRKTSENQKFSEISEGKRPVAWNGLISLYKLRMAYKNIWWPFCIRSLIRFWRYLKSLWSFGMIWQVCQKNFSIWCHQDYMFLSCHVRVSEWIYTRKLPEC